MICDDCGMRPAEEGKDLCFRCRLLTVGYVWRGGGQMYGKDNFRERTNAEFVAEHIGDTKRDGVAHMGSQPWQG